MYDESQDETLITLTAEIVAAHVSNNSVAVNDLPQLIRTFTARLAGLSGRRCGAEAEPEPKVPIRSSIKPDYIVCLEDGKKLKMLKRAPDDPLSADSGPVSPEVGPCLRLSDGRAQLCRAAPDARQVDRPWHQAPQDKGHATSSHRGAVAGGGRNPTCLPFDAMPAHPN